MQESKCGTVRLVITIQSLWSGHQERLRLGRDAAGGSPIQPCPELPALPRIQRVSHDSPGTQPHTKRKYPVGPCGAIGAGLPSVERARVADAGRRPRHTPEAALPERGRPAL